MDHGTTVNSELYYAMSRKLRKVIQTCWWGLLSCGIVLLHDNVQPAPLPPNVSHYENTNHMEHFQPPSLQSGLITKWLSSVFAREKLSVITKVYVKQQTQKCGGGVAEETGSKFFWGGHQEAYFLIMNSAWIMVGDYNNNQSFEVRFACNKIFFCLITGFFNSLLSFTFWMTCVYVTLASY